MKNLSNATNVKLEIPTAEDQYKKAKELGTIQPVQKNLYCIKDEDMGFMEIIEQPNHMIALRTFAQIANDEKGGIKKYPEKYSLYFMGSYSNIDGKIKTDGPLKIGEASAYVQKDNN